jgi:hypothetical protein
MPVLPRFCFHLAEQDNWPSIQRHGLLPARNLIERAGLNGAARRALERNRREQRTVLPDGSVIRDNKPLPVAALQRCLIGMTPAEWFALLNSKVFFWFDLARLDRQRRACGAHPQMLLVFETEILLAKYEAAAAVTPINTGNAMRQAASRGAQTFVPVMDWRRRQWALESAMTGKPRTASHPPVELAIAATLTDALQLMHAACSLAHDQALPR